MNAMHQIAGANENLLDEIAHTHLSLEMVFFLYAALVLSAAILWGVGVIAFGRCSPKRPSPKSGSGSGDRITPAVP
jgi:hypothetical protein